MTARPTGADSPVRRAGPATPPLRVAFSCDAAEDPEAVAIRAWLSGLRDLEAEPLPLDRLSRVGADVLWIHGIRPLALDAVGRQHADRLLEGRVLLTGGAATLAAAAGLDAVPPNVAERVRWRPTEGIGERPGPAGRPDPVGHASYRGHALFAGLGTATRTWSPAEGTPYTAVLYRPPAWPARGRVLAVERAGEGLDPRRATIWEHDGAHGRALCVGAHLPFHLSGDPFRPHVERLALNALRLAATAARPADEGGSWPRPDVAAREDRTLPIPELPLLEDALEGLEFRLRESGPAAPDAPLTVAGRRAFAAGGGARGLDEIHAHPVRLLSGLRVRGAVAETVTVTPCGAERRLRLGEGLLLERTVVAREGPVCVLEWRTRAGGGELEIDWRSDLRLAAPYPPGAGGGLRWRTAARGLVLASAGGDAAVFAFSRAPELLDVVDASEGEGPAVRVRARFRLQTRESVRLAVVGGGGESQLRRALAAAERVEAMTLARRGHAERLMTDRLSLEAPDPAVTQAVEWAKVHLAAHVAEAPGVGRSILAGYGEARAGERADGAAPPVSYRTEDAVWAALACLATGDFDTARDVLAFLGRHQDLTGAIPHECTTSGWAYHGGADATTLYLLLAARLPAWSGDLRLLRGEWPRILRAYGFCRSADRGAPALWAAAVRELADAADAVGETGAAVELRGAGDRARAGPESGSGGPNPWQTGDGIPDRRGDPAGADSARSTAMLVLSLVHGLLGAEPDATRGRLVLRTRPPAQWDRFTVRRLAIGDASVTVSYRREGDAHRIRLDQERGAVPLQVALEPSLPGRRLRSAHVDGVPADLDARPTRDRLVVPLQVVLDHPRDILLALE